MFIVKCLLDGAIERYKRSLVAKRYIDKTFSLVPKIGSVRILISLAANLGWPLFQMDVKNAFLHGDLDEMYMEKPPRFVA